MTPLGHAGGHLGCGLPPCCPRAAALRRRLPEGIVRGSWWEDAVRTMMVQLRAPQLVLVRQPVDSPKFLLIARQHGAAQDADWHL